MRTYLQFTDNVSSKIAPPSRGGMSMIDHRDMFTAQSKLIGAMQKDATLQRAQDFNFNFNDSQLDTYDGHDDGEEQKIVYPKKGCLEGETEQKFEAKMPEELAEYYWDTSTPLQLKSIKSVIQRKLITLKSGGGTHDFIYVRGANQNINFSANTGVGNYDPTNTGTQVNLQTGCAIPKWGVMLSGKMVKIAPNGKRSQHFSIADRLNPGAAAIRSGVWTWHHLDTPYNMVLVDSAVHCPGFGGFFHHGGMKFWT